MFVRASAYNRLVEQFNYVVDVANTFKSDYFTLLKQAKAMQAEIDVLRRHLTQANRRTTEALAAQTTLQPDDIKRLLQLCHPDKHNGSQTANDMTRKLLALRK